MIDGEGERRGRIDDPPSVVEDDPLQAVEQAEPYFPPTDPVIGPGPDPKVVGGFGAGTADPERPPLSHSGGVADEALASRVRAELRQDAATAGLDLDVGVENGVVTLRGTVDDLTDIDNAAAVAGRVSGIQDVVDELEVADS